MKYKVKAAGALATMTVAATLGLGPHVAHAGEQKDPPAKVDDKAEAKSAKKAEAKVPPKPATRAWTVNKDGISYTMAFTPGIPDPNKVTEVLLQLSEIPKSADPRFGTRVPINDASIVVELSGPAGDHLGRYRAHKVPLSSGRYGLHVTPTQQGLYTLAITGKTGKGKKLEAEVKLPAAVWPLPTELQGSGDDAGNRGIRRPVVRRPLKAR